MKIALCFVGNVSKVSMQVNARNNTSSNSFFRNSILWRQARKGHLIAFAGLFLFQEENQDAMKKWQHQYGLFESVCQSIHVSCMEHSCSTG